MAVQRAGELRWYGPDGLTDPTVKDVVVWLREQGAGEVVEPHWDVFGRSSLPFDGPSAGRYLIVPVEEANDEPQPVLPAHNNQEDE